MIFTENPIIRAPGIEAELTPLGGKLLSLCLDGENLLWSGDPAYWDDRAPILFPFCGRCRDGFYRWQGKRYPMPIHGFLPQTPMEIAGQGEDFIRFHLRDNPKTRSVYPFAFTLELTYRALDHALTLEIELTAKDGPVPFSVGAHPGFVLPGEGPYRLELSPDVSPICLEITRSGLLGKARTPLSPDPDGGIDLTPDLLGECGLFLQSAGNSAILSRPGASRRIRIGWEGMDVLGLWQAANAPFVCVEPWAGLPARDGEETDLSDKPGARLALPGRPARFGVKIEIL